MIDPLRILTAAPAWVVGQIGQTVDGRIATITGASHYINGPDALDHLHRLRALADAVVVGVNTVIADDPRLTVRRVLGRDPVRVILDPRGRLPSTARLLAEAGHTVVLTEAGRTPPEPAQALAFEPAGGEIDPKAVIGQLRQIGLHRILVEGGAQTLSRFLAAQALDRLHVLVGPMILGSGRAALDLPPVLSLDQARPVAMRAYPLGSDVLLDCDLRPGG